MQTILRFKINFWLLAVLMMLLSVLPAQEKSRDDKNESPVNFTELAQEVAVLWGEKVCAAEENHKYEEIVISIACNAEYTSAERDKFLDFLFKKGFIFGAESYTTHSRTGHYWYKFEQSLNKSSRPIYFRLHIISEGSQWGSLRPPTRLAIYVDNLISTDEITAWQTLGVPVSFGVKPRENTKDLLAKIDEYKQEAWLALDVNPTEFSEPDKPISIQEIIEKELIAPYVKTSIEQIGEPKGVVIRNVNSVTSNVATLRALFTAIKTENKTNVLLPANSNRILTTTANVMAMNFRLITYDMTSMCAKSPQKIWGFLKSKSGRGGIVAKFPASAKRCALQFSKSLRRNDRLEFKSLSNFYNYKE